MNGYSSNLETLAFHFMLIGICYVLEVGISEILKYLPSFLGTSMSSRMFMNGMYAVSLAITIFIWKEQVEK